MSTQVQRRKGTTVQHSTFTGASAELTVDTTKNTVVVHDGSTAGGIPLAKETGSAISATSLSLPNSTTNGVAFVNSSKVVVAGSTFTFDGTNLSVNGITVGKGAGSSSFNTAVGELALGANTSSATNTAVGYNAMKAITTGSGNTAVGAVALTLASDTGNNTAIGRGALFPSTGTQNTALGYNAGGSMSSGSKNVIIGSFSGNDYLYGTGLDIRTLNNYIVLSDGDANVRAYWNGANPTFPGALTLSDGTANGVPYLNGSKVLTSGTALTFDGTKFGIGGTAIQKLSVFGTVSNFHLNPDSTGNVYGYAYNDAGAAYTALRWDAVYHAFLASGSEGMRLTSTGLGIGTSSPAYKLDVTGTINSGASAATGFNMTFRTTGITTGRAQTYLNNTSGDFLTGIEGSTAGQTISGSAAYSAYAGTFTANPLYLVTNATIKATIDSSGNLGVGATSGFNAISGTETTVYIKNSGANIASLYIEASRKWAVISGTSGQLGFYDITAGSERASIDSSGNLLVGTTTNNTIGAGYNNIAISGTNGGGISYQIGATLGGQAYVNSGGMTYTAEGNTYHRWYTNSSERMRLDSSGNLLVGTTVTDPVGSRVDGTVIGSNAGSRGIRTRATAGYSYIGINSTSGVSLGFYTDNGTAVVAAGNISSNGSTTTYNTSSDYRLKNITGPITTSGAYIDSLKPVEGTWKADGSTFVGLIAHETQEASRTTVATGTKDGEQMQGMDYSSAEIIANLIAELQSLRKRLAAAGI